MKYIIYREADGGEFPLFCLAPVSHRDLAGLATAARPGRTVVSAGFVEITEVAAGSLARCFGASESLGLAARPEADSRLIGALYSATIQNARFLYGVAPFARAG